MQVFLEKKSMKFSHQIIFLRFLTNVQYLGLYNKTEQYKDWL